MTRRTRIAIGVSIAVDVLAAVILGIVGVPVAAFAIAAVAAVVGTAWAFYEIGASEDRDRREGRI